MALDSGGILGELLWGPQRDVHVLREGIPAIGEAPCSAQRRRAFAAGPDGRVGLLDWLGRELDIGEAAVGALERGIVLCPQLSEGADVLIADGAALLERRGTQGVELFTHPPDATPDNDPPLGEHVDRGQHLGGEDGRTVRQDHDGCEQFGRGRDAREEAQQRQRLQILPLRLPGRVILPTGAASKRGLDTFRKDDVVGNGEDAKAHRLALLRQRRNVLRRRHGTAWWHSKAKFHGCLLLFR
jgi:hypothetical protein